MRVLILGGDGMIGSGLAQELVSSHDVAVTVRNTDPSLLSPVGIASERVNSGVDVRRFDSVVATVASFRPEVVVNAVGLVKQMVTDQTPYSAIELNALFPHRLAGLCRAADIRLVHLSSDCVFSGRHGGYTEDDQPDPVDVYGMTKALGELRDPPFLTLRTSTIGLELRENGKGLVEWFLRRSGRTSGYRQAIYTGLTTMELGRVLCRILEKHEDLSGLWHVASEPVTKFDLLTMLAERLGRTDIDIVPDDGVVCDRSLSADRLRTAIGYHAPSWSSMLDELAGLTKSRNAVHPRVARTRP